MYIIVGSFLILFLLSICCVSYTCRSEANLEQTISAAGRNITTLVWYKGVIIWEQSIPLDSTPELIDSVKGKAQKFIKNLEENKKRLKL